MSWRGSMRDRSEAENRAKELVSHMTLFERASQLCYDSPAIRSLGIPAYNWWNEALHGVARAGTATVFPVPIALAATFDAEIVKQVAETIAQEGRAKYNYYSKQEDRGIYKGLTYWSPNINLFRDPRWGRGHETYGEDPYLTGTMGVSFITGLQGNDPHYLKVAACVKHLAVHSGPEALRHEFNAVVSQKDLWESYLPAFQMCIEQAEAEGAMGGYNRMNDEPCCGSFTLIRDILRGKWGFKGYYVSDCWALRDFHEHHGVTSNAVESAALAMHAGCDLNCGNTYLHILEAYNEGLVTEEEITTAAQRVFTTRFLLGCFDHTKWDDIPYSVVDSKPHKQLNEEAARRSIVLLKNDGILPLTKKHLKTIGVIGPNADSRTVLQGNYHGTASRYITVLNGIQDEVADAVKILYSIGCELTSQKTERLAQAADRLSEAIIVAQNSDVVILCVGLDESIEGEAHHISTGEMAGGDKEDLYLPDVQQQLIKRVIETGIPTIVCVLSGSALDLTHVHEKASAVLQLWYPGATGGKAVADILFGNASPSGKLPITFYATDYKIPDFTDYSMENRTYRYIEQPPLYPFGYGLTYGNVQCIGAEFETECDFNSDFDVSVTLKNDSDTATHDVLQAYIKNHDSTYAVPNFSLCSYKKVYMTANETKTFVLTIQAHSLTVVNDEGQTIIDGSRYTLYIGTHAPDTRSVELSGTPVIGLDFYYKVENEL